MSQQVHGTAVCDPLHAGAGVLIIGPSGSGKSALALQLLAYGCQLVSDDIVALAARGADLIASNPTQTSGIEARGIGILNAPHGKTAVLKLVVDLSESETDRLPQLRSVQYAGISLPVVHKSAFAHFPAAILHYIRYGRMA
ncbi:MAG: serine kinase [Deltaproteobacteria bacterium]